MSSNIGFVVAYNKPEDTEKAEIQYKLNLSLFNITLWSIVENKFGLKEYGGKHDIRSYCCQ